MTARTLCLSALALAPKPTPTPQPRRIAVRAGEPLASAPEIQRLADWGKRRGVEVVVGPEADPVPKDWDALRLSTLPAPNALRPMLAPFPLSFEGGGFTFDGRAYRGADDAIALNDPGNPRETLVLGNSADAIADLTAHRIFSREKAADYEVVSGGLSKEGRFARKDGALAIDRASDRDAIAGREEFFAALKKQTRGRVVWEVRESELAAAAKWEKPAAQYLRKGKLIARVFPDAATKGLYTGSSRPADLSPEGAAVRVDIDVSAPAEPDLISPVLAAAGLAAGEPALLARPTLLAAAGARRFGSWWGREVRGFAAFTKAGGVEPSVEEVLESADGVSPVLGVGAAASWLDAGARLENEAAVEKALAKETGLSARLSGWRDAALRQTLAPPARRPMPEGFLRGASYAMSNTIEDAYAAPRSRETLKRLSAAGFDSISVMPYAFARDSKSDRIAFVHRNARGETDEGTVRAVFDAHGLEMTAMVKPQLWVGGGAFVGDIAMPDDKAWRAWFDSYRRFVVHHAVVAEASGADLFCVGTELKSSEDRKNDWKEVIAAVRLATGAPLTYAANWASNAGAIPFWEALDAIGVDFYDPLGKREKLSDSALEEGARRAAAPLAELSRKLADKPVIFTEAGFPPVRAAWLTPHDGGSSRPVGGPDAARSVAAVYRALAKQGWWKGVYWWKVFSDGKAAPPGERGFNFLGTPAEKAILDGFKARP